jgi:hypothetical protein
MAINRVTNKVYVVSWGSSDNVTIIDGATNCTVHFSAGVNPQAVGVNPVTDKIYIANRGGSELTVIDEAPVTDTKVWAVIDTLPQHTTTLARPTLTGKGVNRWSPGKTAIQSVLWGMNSAQKSWKSATISGGAGTDSVRWSINWGTDSLIKGENYVLGMALESEAATCNNTGWGTPVVGNMMVYPIYRIDALSTPVTMARSGRPASNRLRIVNNPLLKYASMPGHGNEMFSVCDLNGRVMGTYRGNRIAEGLPAGLYYVKSKAGAVAPMKIEKLRD